MNRIEFLIAELGHAERHLARTRRLQQQMRTNLEQTGLDELKVYEALIAAKAYRQLQRDESFYQQMCLRLHRNLARYQAVEATPTPSAKQPEPIRKTPALNAPCPCGSSVKYKRCCGNPRRQLGVHQAA